MFLHPDLPLLLAAAHERGITVSIDGATQAVYETYRVHGNVERVLANVRTINELKRRYGCDKPRLTWQFVIFGHNEHEIAEARRAPHIE